MEALSKWAIAFLEKLSPIPVSNLLAFAVVALLVIPLIRKAFRSPPEPEAPDAVPMVMLRADGVYTILTDMQIEIHRMSDRLMMIEQMMRRRQKPVRNRRKKEVPSVE